MTLMDPINTEMKEIAQSITKLRGKKLTETQRYGPLVQRKLDVLDFAFNRFGVLTFADLGAAFRVDGGYSFYALDTSAATKAIIVDSSHRAFGHQLCRQAGGRNPSG